MFPKRFRVIDLTHPITASMPVYPGSESPILETAAIVNRDGFAEKRITFLSHTGTHLDAPAHILEDAPSLDTLGAARFVGPARVLDLRGRERITAADIRPHLDALQGCDFALLRTGWELYWGQARYFEDFPVLDEGAARLLADAELSGIGVDAVSVDTIDDSEGYPVHQIFFRKGMMVVENLANLASLPDGEFTFSSLPLPIAGGDGSPVRAVAIVAEMNHLGELSP